MHHLRNTISNSLALVGGIVLGATGMYLLDPDRGARRRALLRDQAVGRMNDAAFYGRKRLRDLGNRIYGTGAEMGVAIRDRVRPLDDAVLEERVKAQLGHVVSHPGALSVCVENGRALISGPVLGEEIEKIEKRLAVTRGLKNWKLDVDAHAGSESIPGLQGKSRFQIKRERGQEVDEDVA